MTSLIGKKAVIIAANEFEDSELLYPLYRLKEEGVDVTVASLDRGEVKGKHGLPVMAKESISELKAEAYDCLIIPGGWSPDRLRIHEPALKLVRRMHEDGKIIASICHGPHVLISAGILRGRHVTGYRALWDDLRNAGAIVEDKPMVRDGNIITSRIPEDLPIFCKEIIKALLER